MAVKAGYKQSEVGVIPEDWEVVTLGSGLCSKPSYGVNAPAVPYSDRLPTYIRITDIDDDGRFAPSTLVSVNLPDTEAYFLEDGDIVFARTGATVGKSYLYQPTDGRLVYAGFLIRVRPDSINLYAPYVAEFVKTGTFWRWVRLMSMRSGQPGINGNEFAQMPIPKPPLPEQRAIAAALSDADALLAALDRLLAKQRAVKQAAMQQLLTGQTRLPGFEKKPGYKQTEVGVIPTDWNDSKLCDVCTMKSGDAITAKEIDDSSQYPCYGGNGLRGYTTRYTHDGTYALIGRQGALCGNVIGAEGKFFASEHAVVVTARQDISIHFLTYVLGEMNLNRYSESSAQPGLSVSKLLQLPIAIPSTEMEQTAIAAVLSDMDAELAALERRRAKTRDVKQAMMQELLTGRTRLV